MTNDCPRRIARGRWAEDESLQKCSFPIGPRNTCSNLAYVANGISIYSLYPDSDSALMFMAAMIVLGCGSGLYHSLKYIWANNADWVGMYSVITVLALNGIVPSAAGMILGMIMVSTVVSFLFVQSHYDVHMGIGVILASIRPMMSDPKLTVFSLLIFGAAYVVWQLDRSKSRLVGLWGHAIWHVLTALAMALLFIAQMRG